MYREPSDSSGNLHVLPSDGGTDGGRVFLPPDLAAVVNAWATLPADVREAILRMVKRTAGG